MRTKNSMKNIYYGVAIQVCMTLLGFISRKVFINSLDIEYLGVNGLLVNILSMLSLVEGGIGGSIVYNLYKPLADDDKPAIIGLIKLYKKLYMIIAGIVFLLCLALYPFLGLLMKGNVSSTYITIAYFIFVAKNMVSYLNAHKWSLIAADQKSYILSKYNLRFNILTYVLKIIILILTKNYLVYLVADFALSLIQTMWNGSIVNKRYPYIKTKEHYDVDVEVKNNLKTNTKAIMFHNIGGYCVFGTDNLLISALINTATVGLYSNYTLIINQLSGILSPIINGVGASVGNLVATEGEEKNYSIFKVINLVNFWIYALCTIILFNLLEPFINWWIGKGFLLDKLSFIVILINFYLTGLRTTILTFKTTSGIFDQDKYYPLVEAVINLVASFILVKYLGLAGIFLGTTISTLAIPMWKQPKLVFNNVFNKSLMEYYKIYLKQVIIAFGAGAITACFCGIVVISNLFISIILKGLICVIVPNIIFFFIFYKTEEFKYIFIVINPIFNKIKNKIRNKIKNKIVVD